MLSLATIFFFLLAPGASAMAKPPKKDKPTTGELVIFSFAKEAGIEVDGKLVGKVPRTEPLPLSPGKHTVRVFKRGFTEFTETVTITAGEQTELEADLIAFAGIVTIVAKGEDGAPVEGATVAIDGKLAGKTPFDRDVPAGKRTLVVQADGFHPFTVKSAAIEAGKPFHLEANLKKVTVIVGGDDEGGGVHTKWWFWTIIGVGVATAVAVPLGVVYGSPAEQTTPDPDWTIHLSKP